MQTPDIWNNPDKASKLSQELTENKNTVAEVTGWESKIADCLLLLELYDESQDESLWEELQNDIEKLETELTQ